MSLPLLVLDVDETLISLKYAGNIAIPVERPHLKTFFKFCRDKYQLAIWTAACENWFTVVHDTILEPIFEELEWESPFLFIYHTDKHYTYRGPKGRYSVKPLYLVWNHFPIYGKHNTIMIDDQMTTFKDNEHNGIRIYPYYNDSTDMALLEILDILEEHLIFQKKHAEFPGFRILPNRRYESLDIFIPNQQKIIDAFS